MNKIKKKIFQHYGISLTIIIAIVIVLSFVAEHYWGEWNYIIPVAIALASITFPLLNDAKRRNDREQAAFDYFYYSLNLSSFLKEISEVITHIELNIESEVEVNLSSVRNVDFNVNFLKHIDYTDLNNFCRDRNLLKELWFILSDLESVDNIPIKYNEIVVSHNNSKIPSAKEREQLLDVIEKVWGNIMTDYRLDNKFIMSLKGWTGQINNQILRMHESIEVFNDELLNLMNICTTYFKEGDNEYTEKQAASFYSKLFDMSLLGIGRIIAAREDEKFGAKLIKIELEKTRNRFENFVKETRCLVSGDIVKQIDRIKKAEEQDREARRYEMNKKLADALVGDPSNINDIIQNNLYEE